MSGALSRLPFSAIAMTASELGRFLAQIVVPSSGSERDVDARAPRVPHFLRRYRASGLSSFARPRRITTVPAIGSPVQLRSGMASTRAGRPPSRRARPRSLSGVHRRAFRHAHQVPESGSVEADVRF